MACFLIRKGGIFWHRHETSGRVWVAGCKPSVDVLDIRWSRQLKDLDLIRQTCF